MELPRVNREVPQCRRCLALGHTQAYCFREPRCVLCGDLHARDVCPFDPSVGNFCMLKQDDQLGPVFEFAKPIGPPLPVCALCSENHSGNFRGCKVYREIRKKKIVNLRKQREQAQTLGPAPPLITAKSDKTFANALKGPQPVQQINPPHSSNDQFSFFEKRITALETLVNQLSQQITLLIKVIGALSPASAAMP